MAEYGREQKKQLSRSITNGETVSNQLKEFVDNRFNNRPIPIACRSKNIIQKKDEFGVSATKTSPQYVVDEDQGCSRANKRGIVIYQKGVANSNRVYHASRIDGGNIANDKIHEGRNRKHFYEGLTEQCIAHWNTVAVNATFNWGDYIVTRFAPY